DINQEQQARIQGYFDQSQHAAPLCYHIGAAAEVLPNTGAVSNLGFIAVGQRRTLSYFRYVIDRVQAGGLILVDNVLWKGKIFGETPDKQTQGVMDLNRTLAADQRVEKLILPVRDGLFVLRKK